MRAKHPVKNPMAGTITPRTEGKGQTKAKRCAASKNQRRERASPSSGRKLSHA